MVDFKKTRSWQSPEVRHTYRAKDTILYALGIGAFNNPVEKQQLRFVYEAGLIAIPSMATVLASPGAWMRDNRELGIDFLRLVHGEQSVRMHAPLAPEATVVGRSRVVRLVDKGEGKGALLHVEKVLHDESTRQHIATTEQVLFLRGDGGFSKQYGGDDPAPPPEEMPEREPDRILELATRPDQAALYRLSGDLNPLHIDNAVAEKAGYPRPILHGLATYGMACRAIVEDFCGGDAQQLTAIRARMSAPVFPGETIRLECWRVDSRVAFRGRIAERDATVLASGWATI